MKNITVIGAGQMGNGIAHVFALKGFSVQLVDVSAPALEKAIATIAKNNERMVGKGTITAEEMTACMQNIQTNTSLADACKTADLVVEAATENIDLKLRIFADIDANAPEGCILASNTSSISITRIAAATKRPAAVIGMHFMNPVPVMTLVEIIKGLRTNEATYNATVLLAEKLGKTTVLGIDSAGFIVNRILMPMINEAIFLLQEGVSASDIDTAMKLGTNQPMGPLTLADFIGLDTVLFILQVLHRDIGDDKYRPCPLLVRYVEAGYLGKKTGRGFHQY